MKEVREEWYGDEPLGDERDDLLPSQVTQSSGVKVEPPPVEVVNNTQPDNVVTDKPTDQPEDTTAMKADLSRWQRKALKKIGQSVPFESDAIPYDVRARIEEALPACKTDLDVRRVFAMKDTKPKSEILLLAEAINRAVNER